MNIKKHITGGKLILAVCDDELIGKIFEEGDMQIDLSSGFYRGEKVDEESAGTVVKKAHMLNIVGEKTLKFFIAQGLVDGDSHVLRVKGVPHLQIILRE